MSASVSPRHEAAILPSLPPSPSLFDEVFGSHQHPWSLGRFHEFDPSTRQSSPGSAGNLTKGKERPSFEDEDDDDDDRRVGTHEAYPPMTDQVAETRRVEETLRRWELAERQRRKSLRESAQYTSGPSLLSSVTRTAGLVLSRQSTTTAIPVPGNTRTFKSHEIVDVTREGYEVPLDDIGTSKVAVHSPTPSVFDRSTSLDVTASTSSASDNPFVHPSEHTPMPTRLLTPNLELPPPSPSSSSFADARGQQPESPTCKRFPGSREQLVQLPPSLPPEDRPRVVPLQPTSHPVLRPPRREDPEERQEVRWWHDWLCGCGEGRDRGGDHQAGRTNPFE